MKNCPLFGCIKTSKIWLFFVLLLSLLPLLTLLQPGLPATHDGRDHVARIANFYQSLTEGNLVPRWAGNLNWGYGHPVLMFLYPLPSYLASLMIFAGFGLVDSVKIVFGLSFVFSGLFMYKWVKDAWGNLAGFTAAVLYLFAPYRFVDLYVRGAIGECWAFVWPPLICWLAFKLSQKLKWRYLAGGSLTFAAMILSHNALSLMFLPLIFGYMGYLVLTLPNHKKLSIINYSLLIVFGFGLAFFFWFPAFSEGKYTLRDIVTGEDYAERFRPLVDLFYSPWSYGGTQQLSVQLGPFNWLAILAGVISLAFYRRQRHQDWWLLAGAVVIFSVFVFLMLDVSLPVWRQISLLQKFQFPWRFLSPLVFITAFAGGLGLAAIRPARVKQISVLILALGLLLASYAYWQPEARLELPESFYAEPYPGTTDTGESSPRWSVRFMEDFAREPLAVIDGEAKIEEIQRQFEYRHFEVAAEESSRLVANTLYFPGWFIYADEQLVPIEFQDPDYRGLMTFNLPAGDHQVVVKFQETKLRQFANFISTISLVCLFLLNFSDKIYVSLKAKINFS